MSRSKRKEPVYKDPSNTKGKKFANRRHRRSIKQAIHHEDELMPESKEITNSYDVIDFKMRLSKKDGVWYDKILRK